MAYRSRLLVPILMWLAAPPALSQAPERFYGGPIVGAGGFFRSARPVPPADPASGRNQLGIPATRDAFLTMGGIFGFHLSDRTTWELGASFAANVSDNDAFNDRSLVASTGLGWAVRPGARYAPRLEGGFAFAEGESATRRFGYVGFGIRRWYGERSGWQIGVREHFSDGLHILELRLGFLLR